MKKYVIIVISLIFTVSIIFAKTDTLIDFEKLNKVFYLASDASDFEREGKSIKARKLDKKIKQMLDSMFRKNKVITSTKSCNFKREEYGGSNRYFIFECYKPSALGDSDSPRIRFRILGKGDVSDTWGGTTSESIVEIFEDADIFSGKIIIDKYLNESYELNRNDLSLIVYCKILSIKPITDKQTPRTNIVLSPAELLRKLETGESVPKKEIIKTLKYVITKEK